MNDLVDTRARQRAAKRNAVLFVGAATVVMVTFVVAVIVAIME